MEENKIFKIDSKEWKYEYRKIKDLVPLKKNPRKITQEELKRLQKKINDVGFNDVIKLDNNGNVLSGNQRLKVLNNLGASELKVMCAIPQFQLTDKERQNVIINSNITEGEFDYDLLDDYNLDDLKDWGVELGTINNIIDINKQIKNEYSQIHNATFPIKLVEFFINNFCVNSILDLFGGTGTTLIVAEKLNKKWFMMEKETKYCDLILSRYEKTFNQKAELILDKNIK